MLPWLLVLVFSAHPLTLTSQLVLSVHETKAACLERAQEHRTVFDQRKYVVGGEYIEIHCVRALR